MLRTYLLKLDQSSFDAYSNDLSWFRVNMEFDDFVSLVTKMISAMTSRGRKYLDTIDSLCISESASRDEWDAIRNLYFVIERMIKTVCGSTDLVLSVSNSNCEIFIVMGEVSNTLTLPEFKYFLKLKEEEGCHINKEIYKLIEEFVDVGHITIFESFKK